MTTAMSIPSTFPDPITFQGGGMRLLSPQHWAQENHKQGLEMTKRSAHVSPNGSESVLTWADGTGKLTVPIDPHNQPNAQANNTLIGRKSMQPTSHRTNSLGCMAG